MSDPPLPRGDNPPAAPLTDAPATAPTDRAAADAARMEAERLRLEATPWANPVSLRIMSSIL